MPQAQRGSASGEQAASERLRERAERAGCAGRGEEVRGDAWRRTRGGVREIVQTCGVVAGK